MLHLAAINASKSFLTIPYPVVEFSRTILDLNKKVGPSERTVITKLLKERTPSALQRAESNIGLRYSVLFPLPYFDPVQFTIIDPMHNLYLGSGKHAFEVWFERDLITKKDFPRLEEKIKMFTTPYNAGRLPTTIGSGYGGSTSGVTGLQYFLQFC